MIHLVNSQMSYPLRSLSKIKNEEKRRTDVRTEKNKLSSSFATKKAINPTSLILNASQDLRATLKDNISVGATKRGIGRLEVNLFCLQLIRYSSRS